MEHGIEWEQLGTHEEHLSVLDYKKQERTKEVRALDTAIAEKQTQVDEIEQTLQSVQKQVIDLDKIENISVKKALLSDKVTLPRNDFDNLLNAAKQYVVYRRQDDRLQGLLDAANGKIKQMESVVGELKRKVSGLVDELSNIEFWHKRELDDVKSESMEVRRENLISKVLKDNIRFTVVTEFLLSTFTFSLWVELIIIPIMTAITLLDVVAAQKSETVAVHKLLQSVIAFIGLCLVFQTVKVGIREYRELNMVDTLVSFFIPMVYLLFVTPLEYVFELYSKYEMLFIRMCFKEPRDKKVKRKRHLKVIKACGLSVRKIILFQKQCIPRMYVSMSDSEFEALISQLEEICQ